MDALENRELNIATLEKYMCLNEFPFISNCSIDSFVGGFEFTYFSFPDVFYSDYVFLKFNSYIIFFAVPIFWWGV